MSRYIDADKIKFQYLPLALLPDMFVTRADIEKIPTADVAPVRHGHYREVGKRSTIFVCSACDIPYPYTTKYCPNCGAKMDE